MLNNTEVRHLSYVDSQSRISVGPNRGICVSHFWSTCVEILCKAFLKLLIYVSGLFYSYCSSFFLQLLPVHITIFMLTISFLYCFSDVDWILG